ncbi:hypothetical protein LMG26857_06146 [Achromobacter anxifer]|nr:hypothetical protein LMG26857_06146 [Achromobacter anxifer]
MQIGQPRPPDAICPPCLGTLPSLPLPLLVCVLTRL